VPLVDGTGYGRTIGRTDGSGIVIPAPREHVHAALLAPGPGGRFRLELTYLYDTLAGPDDTLAGPADTLAARRRVASVEALPVVTG
jgi:hypothetical protein